MKKFINNPIVFLITVLIFYAISLPTVHRIFYPDEPIKIRYKDGNNPIDTTVLIVCSK